MNKVFVYGEPETPLKWIHEEIDYASKYNKVPGHGFLLDDYINMLKVVRWYRRFKGLSSVLD